MANLDKPLPVPGVFSLEDFQNLSSFSGAGEDNGFNVRDLIQSKSSTPIGNRTIQAQEWRDSIRANAMASKEPTESMPMYGFSRKDISNVGGVMAMKRKDKNETYIPEAKVEETDTLDTTSKNNKKDIAKYAGIGATVGSVVPGLGTAVGAGLGALYGWGKSKFF